MESFAVNYSNGGKLKRAKINQFLKKKQQINKNQLISFLFKGVTAEKSQS